MARAPYLITAGIDFGTAFTKCMVRNSATNELYPLTYSIKGTTKYLLPTVLYIGKNYIIHPLDAETDKGMPVIPYLKMALAGQSWGDISKWEKVVRQSNGKSLPVDLSTSIEGLVGYYLLEVVRRIKESIHEKWSDFGAHADDQIFYNMSLPVAELQQEKVLQSFKQTLYWAVSNADRNDWPEDFEVMSQRIKKQPEREDCKFLGEVTANVMSYRKERGGRTGLFLFVDVGAGTVDLSVFLYPKHFEDLQTYTASAVSLTGSSQIELRAFDAADPKLKTQDLLSNLRQCKEDPKKHPSLGKLIASAKASLKPELGNSLRQTLGRARHMHRPNEFRTMNVLMGGGGWAKVPYQEEVLEICRAFHLQPELIPLPAPANSKTLWPGLPQAPQRFSVALGLSYPFWDWPEELFPGQINPLPRDRPTRRRINPAHEADG